MLRALAIATILSLAGLVPYGAATSATIQIAQSGEIIEEIRVEGANRVDPETIRSYLLVQPGDSFDASRLDRSLKSLFATGLFADVSFRRQNTALIVGVVENPIINRIAFEGNDRLEDEVLAPEVSLRPRVIYTRTKVQNDVRRILTLYRQIGRFAATVEAKVIQLPQNRVDLVFEISEGDPTEIRNIRFIGNAAYDDDDLRSVVRTKETRWYRFLSADDVYDPDRLTLDRELLRQFYLDEGYADFKVISAIAELTPDRKDFFITFTVDEGERYAFGEVAVDARLKDLDGDALREQIELESGDWYDSGDVDDTVDFLTDEVGNLGYAFVDVRPRINRDRTERRIDITFEINEGPRVFVERIDIVGNVRTIDKVIRREFKMVEGDAFSTAKMRRSRRNIQDLNFFETVEVERLPGSDTDKTVVRVEVQEKSTGSLSFGAGFSTDDGPLFETGIRERNFLGRGQDLGVSARLAAERTQLELKFTEPYFLDRNVAAGFDIFHTTRDQQDESSFDFERTGLRLRTGYPLTDDLRQTWAYTVANQKVENVPSDASRFIRSQVGEDLTSEISHGLIYDLRDSRIFPTDGYLLGMDNDLAGFGGDKHYIRNEVRGDYYMPIVDDWILNLAAEAGIITGLSEDIDLIDRFFVGGSDLRGFAASGVGPRDNATSDSLGGEWKYTGTAQVFFPMDFVSELDIRGRVFTDFGSVGELTPGGPDAQDTGSLRMSVGVGATWVSAFGPIGLDIGQAVIKEDFDETEIIRLNFGTRF